MHLFSPLQVGRARLPNRIALTAVPSGFAGAGGFAGPAFGAYYAERARGGAGLIVLEAAWPLPPSDTGAPHLGLYADAHVTGLRECIGAIHRHGALAFQMIDQPAPAVAADDTGLDELGAAWVAAAWRAHAAGADGVMFSCADGGPFDQLLSPSTNRRTDQYGGDLGGRLLLLQEVVERVKGWIGGRLLVGVRLNVGELGSGSLPLQDARVAAKRLTAAGADLLEISAEGGGNTPIARFPGWRVPLAAEVRAVIDIPVMVGGLLADAELADSVIREGSADIVALGETLRAEPAWPQYARQMLGR